MENLMIDFILFMLLAFTFPLIMLYLWSKDTPPDHEKDIEIYKDYNYKGDEQ